MLASHERCDANEFAVLDCKRQQQERLPFSIIGDNDKRMQKLLLADIALPGCEKVKTLVRRESRRAGFQIAPDRLSLTKIVHYMESCDATRTRRRFSRAVDGDSHGHRKTCLKREKIFNFNVGRALQRSVNKA